MLTSVPPDLTGLQAALAASAEHLARVDAARQGILGPEGGDVGAGGSRLVTRHVANYLASLDLARRHAVSGAVVDVGSGAGALGAWVAGELDAPLYLVDRAGAARSVAARAFPDAHVEAHADRVPPESARLVTAMEVIEHIRPREQPAFVRELGKLLAPGGLLVMSTPDERLYRGGWSAYQPHVGPLSHGELVALLGRNLPWPATVWRLEGQPFELGRFRAMAEPTVNRVWGLLERRASGLTARALRLAAGRRRTTVGTAPAVWATADPDGRGTGLLGVVERPAD